MSKRKSSRLALSTEEIRVILRAADDLIGEGGRTLLTKVLRGSKEENLLKLELDRNPSYGFYAGVPYEEVLEKVDWMLDNGYLETQMNGKLPTIIFSRYGWMIERERYAEELLREWESWADNGVTPASMEYLKDRNRGTAFLLLYKVLCTGDPRYIPFLERWASVDYQKVKAEIRKAIEAIEARSGMDDEAWERLKGESLERLLVPSKRPLVLSCERCEDLFLMNERDPGLYGRDGFFFPKQCARCAAESKQASGKSN
ncbi:RQC-minor-1 family DNA-binding protein [Cohnella fermenti]|nr:RQC-minor-1 family DNA-binding protein [Cohnella fermenti]